MELFDSQTVRQNVALGCEGALASFNPLNHVFGTPKQRREVEVATQECLSWCGIDGIADRPAGSLSTGQRRLVELARALAGSARIVLLDEPSSGLDRRETELFGQILRRAVDERGIGIVIVEHDMSLVSTICDYIYVFDFGQLLYQGEPADVLTSSVVRTAYLGEDDPNPGAAGRFGAGAR
jgi:ABC-type branched-subunit amino acid transport system ATPase component